MGNQSLRRRCPDSESSSPSPKRPHLTTTRFLILSDTHDAKLGSQPEADVVLHCGDLTEDGSPESLASAIEYLGEFKAERKLVIAGNHEISLDEQYYLAEGGNMSDHVKAADLVSRAEKDHGVTFLEEGTHEVTLKSGATFRLFASPYTPKYGASAFQYPSGSDRYNPPTSTPPWATNIGTAASIIPLDVDIVMTHGPPKYILDKTADGTCVEPSPGRDHDSTVSATYTPATEPRESTTLRPVQPPRPQRKRMRILMTTSSGLSVQNGSAKTRPGRKAMRVFLQDRLLPLKTASSKP